MAVSSDTDTLASTLCTAMAQALQPAEMVVKFVPKPKFVRETATPYVRRFTEAGRKPDKTDRERFDYIDEEPRMKNFDEEFDADLRETLGFDVAPKSQTARTRSSRAVKPTEKARRAQTPPAPAPRKQQASRPDVLAPMPSSTRKATHRPRNWTAEQVADFLVLFVPRPSLIVKLKVPSMRASPPYEKIPELDALLLFCKTPEERERLRISRAGK